MTGDLRTSTYPGGITGLLQQMEGRRDPFDFAEGEALPPLDADLEEMARNLVPPAAEDPLRTALPQSSNHRKFLELRKELAGHSELAVLHGLLIAHLRKRSQPAHCAALFVRLWREQATHLLEQLNPRWQVSAITTFADHGQSPLQRQVGGGLSVLFNMMKLYETERCFSGVPSDQSFGLEHRAHSPLPLQMDAFSLENGGLDVNMLGRLWQEAAKCEVTRPLAHHLLDQVIHDPHTVFCRLRQMRKHQAHNKLLTRDPESPSPPVPPDEAPNIAPILRVPKRRSGLLRWGVVCTTNAPLPRVLAWAAHYLELGADHLYLFLDAPDPEITDRLTGHERISIITCDAAYWRRTGKARPRAHQLRQVFNATRILHETNLDFLGHMDVDEFVISPIPVARALDLVPPEDAFARVRPVELLTPLDGPPRHFKRSFRQVDLPQSIRESLYPTFAPYLRGGFVSHTTGKIFARTGAAETRLGIHTLIFNDKPATNRTELPRMALAHLHSESYAHFRDRMAFRLERGSYRRAPEREKMALADVLDVLQEHEGEAGLRAFYDEMCTARPALLTALAQHDLLVTHDLELEAKIARQFGDLAPGRACGP